MKIAFVSSGSSIHVKKIANYLVEQGHSITLYTMRDSLKLVNDFDKRVVIRILPFSGKIGYYLNAPYLRKKLKENQYDLINSHFASGFGTLSCLTNVHPIALAVFGADVYDYPFKSHWHMQRIIKNLDNADVLTSTSHVMAKKVREFYKKDKPIYVTPFGVDLEIFKPMDIEKDETFEFGIVKKIEHKYGIGLLLQAYKLFLETYPNSKTRLVIYGRGSALEEYRTLSMRLNINNNVRFMGFIQNELVPLVLNHMDVACFPSILDSESFGVAAVEAMACGVPVVASDASGFTEVIEDRVTGIIVPKKNVTALFEAMVAMYEMPAEKRINMGKAGIQRVNKLYNFDNNMKTYENAIMRCVE